MQATQLNREAFERKISKVYDSLEAGDLKGAMRQVNGLLEKNEKKMHQIERFYYRIVRCYVLDKSNKRQEALLEVDEIVKEILDTKVSDGPLLEQVDVILQEIGCFERLLTLREKLAQMYPGDKQIAVKLFTQYTYQNEYLKMSTMAGKIEK